MTRVETEIEASPAPGPVSRAPLVRVRDVSYTFGEGASTNRVLKNNNLELYPGELVIMTGQSGSGKTTLLTLIGGLRQLQPQGGNIEVLGHELAGMSADDLIRIRRRIGFVFQAHNLFGSLTAVQNVRLALELGTGTGAPARTEAQVQQRAIALLERLGLGQTDKSESKLDFKPQELSGGQRQRVAIARALANEPQLILADEPTAALDAESAEIVVNLLNELVGSGEKTAIVVTHDAKILKSAHRIVKMEYGQIVSNIVVERAERICKFLLECKALKDLISGMLTDTDLEIADKMTEESFSAGSVIIRQGEPGDKFYMIRSGVVEVTRRLSDGSLHQDEIVEGGFFGEVALLRNEPRNATIVARTPVDLYVLEKKDFEATLKKRSGFEEQLQSVLAHRL
jgi:putative ABC transport system ATP-binding protein